MLVSSRLLDQQITIGKVAHNRGQLSEKPSCIGDKGVLLGNESGRKFILNVRA